MSEVKHYLFIIQPYRADFIENPIDSEDQIMAEHFSYLKALLEKGKLLMAGPVVGDNTFGIGIYITESLEEAKALINNDPSVKAKIMIPELHPFRLSLWKAPE